MTNEKFKTEVNTLKSFFEIYCHHKHKDKSNPKTKKTQILKYKDDSFNIELTLCNECNKLINYSFNKLKECPHQEKPRCRRCPNPCYEKEQWKHLAKIMRYSAFKLELLKIKSFFKK